MQELIKINQELIGTETVNSVNARELYEILEIKKDFADWMRVQIKSLALKENTEFITFKQSSKGGRPTKEYIIKSDTAEHIAMASRTLKGKEVRQYFIDVRNDYIKQLKLNSSDQVEQLKQTILKQNKLIATLPTHKESDTFMNDSSLHNNFLDFLYQANKITHEVNSIRHLSAKVDETHQSMSNFMAFITHRYEKIRGVSKYKMPRSENDSNIYVLQEYKKAK